MGKQEYNPLDSGIFISRGLYISGKLDMLEAVYFEEIGFLTKKYINRTSREHISNYSWNGITLKDKGEISVEYTNSHKFKVRWSLSTVN